jgi:hypothetical protein
MDFLGGRKLRKRPKPYTVVPQSEGCQDGDLQNVYRERSFCVEWTDFLEI